MFKKRKITIRRFAYYLLIVSIVLSCVTNGIFAKFTTEDDGGDGARVAKFGVAVTANGETFTNEYAKDDTSFTLAANTVVSADDVIAPGTAGDMASMTLTGTPEVAVRVSYEIPEGVTMFSGWKVNGAYYCPIVITVEGTKINGLDYNSEAKFQEAVANAIKGYSIDYPAGKDLSTVGADSLAISWEWPFSTSADNDVKDTALGDAAAAGKAATINLTVKTTVTQID